MSINREDWLKLTKLSVAFINCLSWIVDPSGHSVSIPLPTLTLPAELTGCYLIVLLRLPCVSDSVWTMTRHTRQVRHNTAADIT